MRTRQITRENWNKFFDAISEQYLDWQVKAEVIGGELGAQSLIEGLPFIGITLENDNDETITISVGTSSGDHETHRIGGPMYVAFESESDTGPGILDVEQRDGTKTLLHFLRPAGLPAEYKKPEMMAHP